MVGRIRRLAGTRKVGHAGTLDPMATGLLIIGVEKATRLLGYLALSDKAYEATIRLGISTITDDAEGEVVTAVGAADLEEAEIEAAMAELRGDILQVPAAVSAIKVGGVRSYKRVRAGESVALSERAVSIRRFDALDRKELQVDGVACVDLKVLVECSSGTYVRALARDLGAALGVGGHLTTLRRTRVGTFTLDEAQTLDGSRAAIEDHAAGPRRPHQLRNADRHRGPGPLHPKRSPVGWCDLARPHDSIARPRPAPSWRSIARKDRMRLPRRFLSEAAQPIIRLPVRWRRRREDMRATSSATSTPA